ncbi:MAG: hypothetical protein AAF085_04315 [Planctomycetota bacterium]
MLASAAQSGYIPYLLFESPGWLMMGLAVFFAATRIIGRRTGNKRLLHLSWIAVGLIAALFASSYFVTTQREQLTVALKELLLAVEDRRIDDVRSMMGEQVKAAYAGDDSAPPFLSVVLTREQILALIETVEFDDIILINHAAMLDPQDGFGTTSLRVNVKGSVGDFPGTNVSIWGIRWQYVDGQWVAIRLECIEFGGDAWFNRPD